MIINIYLSQLSIPLLSMGLVTSQITVINELIYILSYLCSIK